MQTQTTITNTTPVHIKVAFENEFRRFLLSPVTFDNLKNTVSALFSLSVHISLKFQDDENDWVLVTSDQELVYATELSSSPLRLQVKLLPSSSAPATTLPACPKMWAGKWAGHHGRMGKGCNGRQWGGDCKGGFKSPEERLSNKSSRLTERINFLEATLNNPEKQLPLERERVLRWRLAKLQEKLAYVKTMKESSEANPTPVQCEEKEKPSCGRGGRRGGCRGGWRRAMMEEGYDHPCCKGGRKVPIAPEIIANFRQCKADLHAARESGDAEKIEACLEAFKTAKSAKWEARAALRAEAGTDEQKA